MSLCVWKFEVREPTSTGWAWIDAPENVHLLSVGMQGETMVVWGLVNDSKPVGVRRLIVANTGMELPGFPDGARFLGTVTSNGIVWHVWDGNA